jgi:preprotein translocase subunit YajC
MILNGLHAILAQATTSPSAAPAGTTTAPGTGTTGPTVANPGGEQIKMLGFMVVAIVVLFVMMRRTQSKKDKELADMMGRLKPGDKVVTGSGIVGTVVSIKDKTISLRSAETKLEVLKSAVTQVTERAESASNES